MIAFIRQFFSDVPDLFDSLLDSLDLVFSFLGDDVVFLLAFGLAACIFAGLVKLIRG